jgi:hypothetical protein
LSDELEHQVRIVRAELSRQQDEASKKVTRGVVLIAVVPLVILAAVLLASVFEGAFGLVVPLLSAVAYTLIGTVGGVAMIAAGAVESRRIGKQLDDYDNVRQLPAARVVIR